MAFGPEWLLARLTRYPSPPSFHLAFSGGLDSTVLLHLLAALRQRLGVPVEAVHVDHGLHPAAGAWASHCQSVCERLAVPCRSIAVEARPLSGEGPEAAARAARYRALAEVLPAGAVLLTAHHRDDQAETLLLQLTRGAGPHGLAAMPERRPLGRGWLLRPLLDAPRAELRAWAQSEGLEWIDDPSNFDTGYARNHLRHALLPGLEAWRPGTVAALVRSAGHCAEAAALLDELADADLAQSGAGAGELAAGALAELSPPRARNALRRWLRQAGFVVPNADTLERILTEAVTAKADAAPLVAWRGAEVRRYRGRLFVNRPLPQVPDGWSALWDGNGPLALPDGLGRLELAPARGRGLKAAAWAGGAATVAFRQGGEQCRPAGRGRHPLKKLLQEMGVPPWERSRLPLLRFAGELAAVADRLYCEPFAAASEEEGLVLVWRRDRH